MSCGSVCRSCVDVTARLASTHTALVSQSLVGLCFAFLSIYLPIAYRVGVPGVGRTRVFRLPINQSRPLPPRETTTTHTTVDSHWALHFRFRSTPPRKGQAPRARRETHTCTFNAVGLLSSRRGDARVASTTSCVWRSLPYLSVKTNARRPRRSQSRPRAGAEAVEDARKVLEGVV